MSAEASVEASQDDGEKVQIQKILHGTKVGKKSLLATYVETFKMTDGKTFGEDVKLSSLEDGLHMMNRLVQAKLGESSDGEDGEKWRFTLTPFGDFDATLDDLLRAFVQWGCEDESKHYNISKAFRRLESYVVWMEENRAVLSQELTDENMKQVHDMIGMKLTQSSSKNDNDDKQVLVWWLDFHQINSKGLKEFNHDFTMIYYVWACHMVIFQKSDSMIFVQNMAKVGVLQLLRIFPADLSAKLDRLTIGVLPLKMKAIYLLHNPRWVAVILTIMRPFMSKKMRQRMVMVKNNDVEKTLTDVVGLEGIPKGYCDIEGLVEQDLFSKKIGNL